MNTLLRRFLPALLLAVLGGTTALHAGDAPDPLLALPELPRSKPAKIAAPTALKEFAPGVLVAIGDSVALSGVVIIDQGPVDGMEVLACLATGKTHESLVRLDAANGQLVKAAFIAALGLTDGMTAPEATGHPGRGTPLQVVMEWESLDAPGTWLAIDASCLVRDRITDKAYPPLPFIYTGSRFLVVDETAPDGRPVRQERFMLDNTKSVVGVVDEPDALIASPSPGAGFDKHFEANSAICPPAGTKVRLVFRKTTLPLTLVMDAGGGLTHGGVALNDAALDALLATHYGAAATPALRAVAVQVAAATPRDQDIQVRTRILAAAARAKAWVVPVYQLAMP
ncbi:MAG: hypothetical protein H0W78_04160 [Planctomycetes bacterium]|jgi:hypothetical protein|nr:hypothetical protein [Planctomycetota bacterium]